MLLFALWCDGDCTFMLFKLWNENLKAKYMGPSVNIDIDEINHKENNNQTAMT